MCDMFMCYTLYASWLSKRLHFIQQHSAKKSFDDGPPLQHTLPANEKQPFSFTTTVSWTFLEPKYETVKSPPPTLLFSVPHDVFYPFQMNTGVSVVTRRSFVWTSLVVLCTAACRFIAA